MQALALIPLFLPFPIVFILFSVTKIINDRIKP